MHLSKLPAIRVLVPALFALAFFSTGTVANPIGDAKAGQEKAGTCTACHGVDGNGQDPQYPKIAGQHARYAARHLALFKSGERENAIMLGFAAALSEKDMADISAWFATQKIVPGVADEAYVEKGKALYRGGRNGLPSCMGCHGPSGKGNPASAYPAIGGQYSAYTKLQLERFRAGTVYGKDDYPNKAVMAQVSANLTDEEIAALASYIEGLHAR
jgi:cytochrome c553